MKKMEKKVWLCIIKKNYRKIKNSAILHYFLCVINSYLSVHAFVLVVDLVVRAASRISSEKAYHFVFVKIDFTAVCIGVFIVIVMLTALAACRVLDTVF